MYFYSNNPRGKPRWVPMIFWSLAMIGLGIFIVVDTREFAQILALAFGIFLVFTGMINIYIWFRTPDRASVSPWVLWLAVFRLVFGVLAIGLPVLFASITWIAVLYLLAAQFLISAIVDLSLVIRVNRTGFPLGVPTGQHLSSALLSLLAAVILFIAPRFIGILLLRIIAISLILIGIGFLSMVIRFWWLSRRIGTG